MEEQGPPAAGCLCSAPETTEKTLRKMEKTSLKVLLTLHILTFIRSSVRMGHPAGGGKTHASEWTLPDT